LAALHLFLAAEIFGYFCVFSVAACAKAHTGPRPSKVSGQCIVKEWVCVIATGPKDELAAVFFWD